MTALDPGAVEVPDFAEAMTAWRVWRVVTDKGSFRLGSVVKPTLWPAGESLTAECLKSARLVRWMCRGRSKTHSVPVEDCQCGIYGASLSLVRQYLAGPDFADPPTRAAVGRVVGQVSLWGTVVECERGLRASHAYPLRLYVPLDAANRAGRGRDQLVAGLEEYGVPVEALPVSCADTVAVLEQQHVPAPRRV